jgi:phosphoserine phosphatase
MCNDPLQMNRTSCDYYCYRNMREPNHSKATKLGTIKLVVFDMDGVITNTISSWKYIHDYFGSSNDRSVDDYLKGKIDDMEFIKRDVSLWKENDKPVMRDKLVDILSDVPLMPGAETCIKTLRTHHVQTAIVSAGLDILAERVAAELGVGHVFANGVKTDDQGRLTGEGVLGVALMYKDRVVRKVAQQLQIPLENIVAVGNSCFDIPMFETSGLGIAFNPEDDCVRDAADVVVEGKDLRKILPHLDPFMQKDP